MIAYIIIIMIIITTSILFAIDKRSRLSNTVNNVYLFFSGVVLVGFSGFRGDFTSDYKNFAYLFYFYNQFSLDQIFNYQFGQEIGYVLLNRFIGIFTDTSVSLMLVVAFITIVLYFKEIKKNSVYVWLSVLLFVAIGQYYLSFNLMRQILAVAIIFAGSDYLYSKKMIKYFILVVIASLFHQTALIMVPFYFILNFKFNIKRLLIGLFLLLLTVIYIDNVLFVIQKFVFAYYDESAFGMAGFGYRNVVLPVGILIFVLLHKSILDVKNDNKVNIWLNSIVIYTFFSVLGLRVQMIERIAHFFAPYVLLIIPLIVFKQNNKHLRVIYIYSIVVISIAYNYLVLQGSGFDPFYFIWDAK